MFEEPLLKRHALYVRVLFFITGFTALLYQVVWFRKLTLIFGNTVMAASATLAAFMLGMAIGALVIGEWSDRCKNHIKTFSWISFLIGISALLTPLLLEGLNAIFIAVASEAGDSGSLLLNTVRFAGAFLSLLLPAMLMGGSLPVLVKGLSGESDTFRGDIGWLYGINTLGASAGVFATGFLLIEHLGLINTNIVGVVGNISVAVIAYSLGQKRPSQPVTPKLAYKNSADRVDVKSFLIYVVIFFSGFIALAFEIIWFRTLILIFGSTTYSFSAMLGLFLFGLGLGSILVGPLSRKFQRPLIFLGWSEVLIGLFTLWTLYQFQKVPEYFLLGLAEFGIKWSTLVLLQIIVAGFFLLVPTILFGVDIPLCISALGSHLKKPSVTTGRVYAVNTAGCVLGVFFASFILLPGLGMLNSLILLSLSAVALGGIVLCFSRVHWFDKTLPAGLALATFVLAIYYPPFWDTKVLSAGPYFNPHYYLDGNKVNFRSTLDRHHIIYFAEGMSSTVAVRLTDDYHLNFVSDGKIQADSSQRSMSLQRLQGHLPMLFHPEPKRVLNIGLGAGITFGALGCYPLDKLEVVEIEPAVLRVAQHFKHLNHNILSHPKATVHIGDGRNFLLLTQETYDVITSDPFEPVHAAATHLYTVEHFQLARARLAADGVMGQFLPLYEMSREDYLTILRSFLEVFPNAAVFYTGDDTVLLGFNGKIHFDISRMKKLFDVPAVSDSLAGIGITGVEQILGMYVAAFREGDDLEYPGVQLNTDNRPIIEFSTPRSALYPTVNANQEVLLIISKRVPPEFALLPGEIKSQLIQQHEALRMALKANTLLAAKDIDEALRLLRKAHEKSFEQPVIRHRLADILLELAEPFQKAGQQINAIPIYREVVTLRPDDFWANFQLARFNMHQGELLKARYHLNVLQKKYPDSALVTALEAYWFYQDGDQENSLRLMEKAVALRPDYPAVWLIYGRLLMLLGEEARANEAFEKAGEESD